MTQIAVGVSKQLTFKKQASLGTPATGGAATGQSLRRVKSTIDLDKATYKSAEILVSQQRRDFRHGVRAVSGVISGELSVGTYQNFFESICRQTAQVAETTGALTNVTAAVTVAPAGTFTRAAGSFLTDGFQIGDVVSWSGWTTTGTNNNANNMVITALTATVMTCYPINSTTAIAAKASGDSVTGVLVGKKTWIPVSSPTRDYYTIEHWFGDIALSEEFTDCVITKATVKAPPTGMVTVDFDVMGLNITTAGAQYFTSPTAQSTGGIEASVNGLLILQGVVVGVVTGFSVEINGNYSVPGGIVGSNVDPDVFPGSVDVTGSLSILFTNATYRDYFINETEVSLVLILNTTNAANTPFTCLNMPRIKIGGAKKDDQEKGLTQTLPFTALEQTAGGNNLANLDTTISIQDSAFV